MNLDHRGDSHAMTQHDRPDHLAVLPDRRQLLLAGSLGLLAAPFVDRPYAKAAQSAKHPEAAGTNQPVYVETQWMQDYYRSARF